MSNRIKVGDTVFELPTGSHGRPTKVVAEQAETPEMLDPIAFTPSGPDLVSQYIARSPETEPAAEPELDRMSEWQAFAGAKSRIPLLWQDYVDGKRRHCGFNSWAFLFGVHWLAFNRLYLTTAIAGLLEMLAASIAYGYVKDDPSQPLHLKFLVPIALMCMPRLIVGCWANLGLLRRATREIGKVRAFKIDNARKLAMIASAGAGSVPTVLALYVILFVIRFILVGG